MAAALTVAEGGARVIILEKLRHFGGTSNFAQGLFAVGSDMQRHGYVGLTRDQAFKMAMDYSHWRADPRIVRAVIDKSAETITWLAGNGIQFAEVVTMWPEAQRTWHIIKGAPRAGGRGSVMIKALLARVRQRGGELWLSTRVKKLIRAASPGMASSALGKITGVVAEKAGKTFEIEAKAVVIATGGYANNKEWVKKYAGFEVDVNLFPLGNIDKMGEGIRMSWEAGAAAEGMGVLQLWRGILLGRGIRELGNLNAAALQPHLWVNQRGERFCDETVAHIDPYEGNICGKQKNGCSYTLFDETIKRHMMEKGIDKNMGTENPPGTPLVDFDKELEGALEKKNPHVFAAGSIEELAGMIGAKASVLKATVEEYNRFCEKGHDGLFAKDRECLRPLKEPRFYALRCVTMTLGSIGGIKINHRTEVVDEEDQPIPGLYAAGEATGGIHGACRLGSVAIIDCLVFGRIAGKSVAAAHALKAAAE